MITTIKTAFIDVVKPFNFALWTIFVVILTVAGPFGTYASLTTEWRFFYWLCVVLISAVLGYQAAYIARHLTRRRHPLVTDLLTTVFLIVTFTPINLFLTYQIIVPDGETGPSAFEMAAYVAAIAFAIMTSRRFIPGMEEYNYLPRSHDSNRPRLLRRVPDSASARILRISSQDHFVDIVTDRGSKRVRMRLADAVEEMDGVGGFFTHRSHWVAETAIANTQSENGRTQLELTNGDMVPVSRTFKPELEKAGVL